MPEGVLIFEKNNKNVLFSNYSLKSLLSSGREPQKNSNNVPSCLKIDHYIENDRNIDIESNFEENKVTSSSKNKYLQNVSEQYSKNA